jgi:hypothetical protein
VRDAAEAQSYPHQDIISGAGRRRYSRRRARWDDLRACVGGISHNEIETPPPEDLTAGQRALNASSTG